MGLPDLPLDPPPPRRHQDSFVEESRGEGGKAVVRDKSGDNLSACLSLSLSLAQDVKKRSAKRVTVSDAKDTPTPIYIDFESCYFTTTLAFRNMLGYG